ncbi:MAG: hypothetical protein HYT72_04330 [Candidatus Aenigmarchaeota archaeon]|nr:hypothetical protein [Candidatus Aenigmarchaeota archaeon]
MPARISDEKIERIKVAHELGLTDREGAAFAGISPKHYMEQRGKLGLKPARSQHGSDWTREEIIEQLKRVRVQEGVDGLRKSAISANHPKVYYAVIIHVEGGYAAAFKSAFGFPFSKGTMNVARDMRESHTNGREIAPDTLNKSRHPSKRVVARQYFEEIQRFATEEPEVRRRTLREMNLALGRGILKHFSKPGSYATAEDAHMFPVPYREEAPVLLEYAVQLGILVPSSLNGITVYRSHESTIPAIREMLLSLDGIDREFGSAYARDNAAGTSQTEPDAENYLTGLIQTESPQEEIPLHPMVREGTKEAEVYRAIARGEQLPMSRAVRRLLEKEVVTGDGNTTPFTIVVAARTSASKTRDGAPQLTRTEAVSTIKSYVMQRQGQEIGYDELRPLVSAYDGDVSRLMTAVKGDGRFSGRRRRIRYDGTEPSPKASTKAQRRTVKPVILDYLQQHASEEAVPRKELYESLARLGIKATSITDVLSTLRDRGHVIIEEGMIRYVDNKGPDASLNALSIDYLQAPEDMAFIRWWNSVRETQTPQGNTLRVMEQQLKGLSPEDNRFMQTYLRKALFNSHYTGENGMSTEYDFRAASGISATVRKFKDVPELYKTLQLLPPEDRRTAQLLMDYCLTKSREIGIEVLKWMSFQSDPETVYGMAGRIAGQLETREKLGRETAGNYSR